MRVSPIASTVAFGYCNSYSRVTDIIGKIRLKPAMISVTTLGERYD